MSQLALIAIVFFAAGCLQLKMLPYLDQALTLQDLSREKGEQEVYAKNADAKFDRLMAAVDNGRIKDYATMAQVNKDFGAPILEKDVIEDGKTVTRSLYRYTLQNKGPNKVYFYHDADGRIVRWEKI